MAKTDRSSPNVLQKILEDAHEARVRGERCLAVFDLDSTLFDLTPRVQEIVDRFGKDPQWRAKYPEACEKLAQAKVLSRDWGIKECLQRAGLHEKDWPEFYRDLHEHWTYCFFSNTYLHQDQPLPGAVEFVRALEAEAADIMYLTGRDVGRMEEGTIASLKAWKFPLHEPHVDVVLKPDPELDDAEFKLAILQDAESEYERIWLFENEPVNLNLVRKHCPRIHLVFIDSTHSGRETVEADLARIPHFEVDMEAFARFKTDQGRGS